VKDVSMNISKQVSKTFQIIFVFSFLMNVGGASAGSMMTFRELYAGNREVFFPWFAKVSRTLIAAPMMQDAVVQKLADNNLFLLQENGWTRVVQTAAAFFSVAVYGQRAMLASTINNAMPAAAISADSFGHSSGIYPPPSLSVAPLTAGSSVDDPRLNADVANKDIIKKDISKIGAAVIANILVNTPFMKHGFITPVTNIINQGCEKIRITNLVSTIVGLRQVLDNPEQVIATVIEKKAEESAEEAEKTVVTPVIKLVQEGQVATATTMGLILLTSPLCLTIVEKIAQSGLL
jgi:hypothetical protein